MPKRMLIDAARPEETRVVVADGAQLEDYDVALASRPQIRGNIYLAKVVRVEASLQAAFVDYGHEKHGFLSFTEIHPDYFQIPVADREAIVARDSELARQEAEAEELDDDGPEDIDAAETGEELSADSGEEDEDQVAEGDNRSERPRRRLSRRRSEKQRRAELYRNYRIQEVIRNGQLILVQATKEQRGSKGAVFSSYISLPGRYTVLMPNTAHGGGVSRKIGGPDDRKRLRKVVKDLEVAEGMSVILRTVAKGRTRAEIRRDFDYVVSLWSDIREKTLNSVGASLVHHENDLVKRAVRDMYQSDVSEVMVAGEEAYRRAKDITKVLSPSKARHVKLYRGDLPFYHSYGIERPLASVHRPEVRLPSGGSMVIAQTEALVTVDINSGRAIRERHIEETALKTNLEAVDELARQFRLRDLAGLIVIDFIGMERRRNNEQVEQRLKEVLKHDRARTHVGRMSEFGLIEMSRQRLRASIHDTQHEPCANCHGHGWIYRPEAHALMVIRALECEVANHRGCRFRVSVPPACAQYLSETMWRSVHQLETQFEVRIEIQATAEPLADNYLLEVVRADGASVSLNPTQANELDSGTIKQGERSRRGARSRASARDEDNADERPARSRRARSARADDSSQGEEEERRLRSRNGRASARRDSDDEKRSARNGRRRPADRADFDDDTEEGFSEHRRTTPVARDEYGEDGDEERRPRARRTRAGSPNGYDDAEGRRRSRGRRGRAVERDPVDDAADDDRTRRERWSRPVDDDDYDVQEERRSSDRGARYADRDADEDDDLIRETRSRRRRSRTQIRQDGDHDAADAPRARGRRSRTPTDNEYDDEFPEEPRLRRRRAQATPRSEPADLFEEGSRTGRRRERPQSADDRADPAADEPRGRRRRARSAGRDETRSEKTEERRPRRSPSRSDTVEDGHDAAEDFVESMPNGSRPADSGDRSEEPEVFADAADVDGYEVGDADSPFEEQSETPLSGRSDRSSRRTRRGSRGGSRRRSSRVKRRETQAPEGRDDLDADMSDASVSAANSPDFEQSADFGAASPDPDPFGAAADVSERDPSAQVSTFATAPAHPFGGADEPIVAEGASEPSPASDDPFGAPAQLRVDPGPVADDAAAGTEDPFAGQEPSSRTDPTARAESELNGSSEVRSEAEAGPRAGRWWTTFRGRS